MEAFVPFVRRPKIPTNADLLKMLVYHLMVIVMIAANLWFYIDVKYNYAKNDYLEIL